MSAGGVCHYCQKWDCECSEENMNEYERLKKQKNEIERKAFAKRLRPILKELMGTANLTTGAVPQAVHGYGFCTLRLTGVVTKENICKVFKKYGVELPDEMEERAKAKAEWASINPDNFDDDE